MAHSPKTPQEYQEEMMRLYRKAHAYDAQPMQNQNNVQTPAPNNNPTTQQNSFPQQPMQNQNNIQTPVPNNNPMTQQNNFPQQPMQNQNNIQIPVPNNNPTTQQNNFPQQPMQNQNNIQTPESHNNPTTQQNSFPQQPMQNQNNASTPAPNNNPMTQQNNFPQQPMQNQNNIPMATPYNNHMTQQNNNINPLSNIHDTNNNRDNNLHNQAPLLESDFISDFPPSASQAPTYNSDNNNYNNENANLNTSVNVSESTLNSPQQDANKPEEKSGAVGWLKIITRTGNEATPLENVAVTVTSHDGTDTILNYTTITDSSGETERIELSAPPLTESLGRTGDTPYSVYDVNIFLSGYYRQESRNVPIFPGVTSIQKFSMIPLPKYSNEFNKTIVYENDEPRFR